MAAQLDPYLCDLHRSWLAAAPERSRREEHGSLLFFDISGFTPLTERLAKRGKAGVEQLIDILNGVLAPLVETAARLGGDTLKFGGDALLLAFEGSGHERRACAAAWDMQLAMAPYRRLETSAGVFSLRASAGVASGRVHTFLVGDRFRELVIAGPVTSDVMGMEREARAGEVLVSDATAAALHDGVLGRPRAGGATLTARPAPGAVPAAGAAAIAGDPALGLPAVLHEHLGPEAESEHRRVTIAFAQFRGLDDILAGGGPDGAAAELGVLMTRAQAACERHGVTFLGTDADANAGKIFLVAGAPTASTDDEDRMLLALREIAGYEGELRIRAGVNRGRVFVVHLGAPQRRTYTAMGDTTNLAARVMGKAPDGGVLATRAVLERVRAPFELTPVAPFAVKGKTTLVDAELVGEPGTAVPRATVGRLPLAGRDAEIAALRAALAASIAGDGQIVELVGEPGIGKSRIVAEVAADADEAGMRRFVVEGGAYLTTNSYFPMRRPLRALVCGDGGDAGDGAVAAALTARVREHLPQAEPFIPLMAIAFGLDLPATPESARLSTQSGAAQMHRLLDRLLAALLPARRTMLLVEDAHWLDEASSELLRMVLRNVGERGWLTLLTRRAGADGLSDLPGVLTRIELEPLGADAARSLVVAGGDALAPHVTAALVERSHGNPLFLAELAAAARAGAELDGLPETVEALLTARIDTLAPADRWLLRRASVLGQRFPVGWLAGMLGWPESRLRAGLGGLGDFLTIDPDGERVRFGHALQREAAYETLPYESRRMLHARAGELIERLLGATATSSAADLLGLHFLRAHEYERAWHYGRIAADQARDRFAPADAAELYRRAIEAARALPSLPARELADVWQDLGRACSRAGEPAAAVEAFTRARGLVGDEPVRQAELMLCHARVATDSGHLGRSVRWLMRGLRLLDGLDGREAGARRAELMAELGTVRTWQGRPGDAIGLLEDAARVAELHDARSALAQALSTHDVAVWHGDPSAGPVHSQRALEIYRELGDHDREGAVLTNLGSTAYFRGRWDEAVALYSQSSEACARAGDLANAAVGEGNIGEVLSDQGRLEEAERRLRHALEIQRGSGYEGNVAFVNALLGRAAIRAGRTERGFELLGEAFVGFRRLQMSRDVVWVEALVAEAHAFAGHAEQALTAADRLVADLAGGGGFAPLLQRVRGCALAQLGRTDEAVGALEASAAEARAQDIPFELALTLDALLALEGEDSDAARGRAAGHRRERDAIVARLDIVRLATPPLAPGSGRPDMTTAGAPAPAVVIAD